MKIKKEIDEISFIGGTLNKEIVEPINVHVIETKFNKKQIVKNIREFAIDELFLDLTELTDNQLYDYWDVFSDGYHSIDVKSKKFQRLKDSYFWHGVIYRLIKSKFKTTSFQDIEYIRVKNMFFFFESDLQVYLGYMMCKKLGDIMYYPPIKKSALCVEISAIDKTWIGKGYGQQMYLAVIEDAGCLLSDTVLYDASLIMWANVLPKYVKYVGYVDDENKLKKIKLPLGNKQNQIKRFFATNNPEFLKEPFKK